MPTFVEAYQGFISDKTVKTTRELNEKLSFFQKNGAKILDVKHSVGGDGMVAWKSYLIIYEAEKLIKMLTVVRS